MIRRTSIALVLACLLLSGAGILRADTPAFAAGPLHSPGQARVEGVRASLQTDVVVLAGGLEAGFRTGMVCRILRGPADVAEIVIIESTPARSAGLILNLSKNQSIRAGDLARVKTLES